ncbi:hypothetical protein pb186bvf_000149 [Paramecium bursaria]
MQYNFLNNFQKQISLSRIKIYFLQNIKLIYQKPNKQLNSFIYFENIFLFLIYYSQSSAMLFISLLLITFHKIFNKFSSDQAYFKIQITNNNYFINFLIKNIKNQSYYYELIIRHIKAYQDSIQIIEFQSVNPAEKGIDTFNQQSISEKQRTKSRIIIQKQIQSMSLISQTNLLQQNNSLNFKFFNRKFQKYFYLFTEKLILIHKLINQSKNCVF